MNLIDMVDLRFKRKGIGWLTYNKKTKYAWVIDI